MADHHPNPRPSGGTFALPTGTEARVCADITKRQQLGVQKYGTSVQDNPLPHRAWLQHAYEEALDMAVYLRRAMDDLDAQALRVLADFEAAASNSGKASRPAP